MVHPQGNANVHRTLRAFCCREIAENTLPGVRQTPLLARARQDSGRRPGCSRCRQVWAVGEIGAAPHPPAAGETLSADAVFSTG